MKRNQSGFTLIEIAIVLVIIGLLLGGVLKGQELINSAKVKSLGTDFRNIPVFVYGYQDKYKSLPGDDKTANDHLGVASGVGDVRPGDGNGILGGKSSTDTWTSTTLTDETQQFWIHVRLAGLSAGATNGLTDYRPLNSVGGVIGIQSNISSANATGEFVTINKTFAGAASTMPGAYIICSEAILGKFAAQLDNTMDDGNPDTGSMRVAEPTATPGQTPSGKSVTLAELNSHPGQAYTVCMGI
jgi:prepilin-type N-terminal cleavage/methylation domain-containing protein